MSEPSYSDLVGGDFWYPYDEEQLKKLLNEGRKIEYIKSELRRSEQNVRDQMKKLGLSVKEAEVKEQQKPSEDTTHTITIKSKTIHEPMVTKSTGDSFPDVGVLLINVANDIKLLNETLSSAASSSQGNRSKVDQTQDTANQILSVANQILFVVKQNLECDIATHNMIKESYLHWKGKTKYEITGMDVKEEGDQKKNQSPTCKYCGHSWEARSLNPKVCPKCKRYLESEHKKRGRPNKKMEPLNIG